MKHNREWTASALGHNLFPKTVFIHLPTLNFPETESRIPGTMVSTYPSCLHSLHKPNILLSGLDPIYSHASLYHVAGTSGLPRLLILVPFSLSYPCFLWPSVSVSLVPLLVTMAKNIMSIYRQHLLGNSVLECGLKCTLQGQASDLPCVQSIRFLLEYNTAHVIG